MFVYIHIYSPMNGRKSAMQYTKRRDTITLTIRLNTVQQL